MTFQEKPHYLPSDVNLYRAPRPRIVEYALAVLSACLAVLLYVERVPEQINAAPQATELPRFSGEESPRVSRSVVAAPTLDCLRLRDRLWLRGAIMHRGDRQQWAECWYGGIDRRDVL